MTCNGEGVRSNHRIKIEADLYGGNPCNGIANMTEPCNNGDCPGTHSVNILNKRLNFITIIAQI